MKKYISISLLLCLALFGQAQDELGIAGSTRCPVNTLWNNPSTIVDSRAFIDFSLAGVNVFAKNNFVYIPSTYMKNRNFEEMKLPGFNRAASPYRVYSNLMIHGPSVTFAIKQHAFGISTAVRTATDVRGVPKELGYYMTEGFQYQQQMGVQQKVKNLRANVLSWAEAGFTYGTIVSRSGDMITQAAVTVKKLWGIGGVGMRIDDWTYIVRDSSNLETIKFSGEYGFNDPITGGFSWKNGSGMGMDLGITFKQRKKQSDEYVPYDPCTDGDYRYRFGFSILDIGRIKFKSPYFRNIFDENEQNQWNDFSNTQVEDLAGIDSLLTEGLGAAQKNADGIPFKMRLPTAFSAQIDYNLGYNFYIYGTITAGVPWKNRLGVQRSSYLGIAPRFETKRFELSVPISLYEFRQPQMGMMVRLNSILIGSDDLLAILRKRDVYGADIYISVKYTMFRHWKCQKKKSRKAPKVKRQQFAPVPCPSW